MQSVDFFTPVVDDPYLFGQIAAANALSDIYTMGGKPVTALNLVSFPCKIGMDRLSAILQGGQSKIEEAGAVIVGGHSVDDREPKYGLAVTGVVDPKEMITNTGARPGQKLILTKKIGTGIISNMRKLHRGIFGRLKGPNPVAAETEQESIESMITLNARAAKLMKEFGCPACTDVTGFGLLGHAAEMIEGTDVSMIIHSAAVPFFSEAKRFAEIGKIPGGLRRNREFRSNMVDIKQNVPAYLADILFDPQTSGGLLISVPEHEAQKLLERMHQAGIGEVAIIGEIVTKPKGRIAVI